MEENEFNISDFFTYCKRNVIYIFKILIIFLILFLLVANAYNFLTEKLYKSNSKIIINGKNSSASIISNYKDILSSENLLKDVIADSNLQYNVELLKKNISISATDGSNTYTISVSTNAPDKSKILNENLVKAFVDKIGGRFENDENTKDESKLKVSYSQTATLPTDYYNVDAKKNNIIAVVGAVLVSFVVVFIRFYFDDSIKNSTNVKKDKLIGKLNSKKYDYIENLKLIRTKFELRQAKTILITCSSERDEEETKKLALSLADSFGKDDKKTLLINANLRNSQNKKGYYNLIEEYNLSKPIENYMVSFSKTFDLIDSGITKDNDTIVEMLNSKNNKKIIKSMKDKYDVVIISSSNVNDYADTMVMSDVADEIALVIVEGQTKVKKVEEAQQNFKSVNKEIEGFIYVVAK